MSFCPWLTFLPCASKLSWSPWRDRHGAFIGSVVPADCVGFEWYAGFGCTNGYIVSRCLLQTTASVCRVPWHWQLRCRGVTFLLFLTCVVRSACTARGPLVSDSHCCPRQWIERGGLARTWPRASKVPTSLPAEPCECVSWVRNCVAAAYLCRSRQRHYLPSHVECIVPPRFVFFTPKCGFEWCVSSSAQCGCAFDLVSLQEIRLVRMGVQGLHMQCSRCPGFRCWRWQVSQRCQSLPVATFCHAFCSGCCLGGRGSSTIIDFLPDCELLACVDMSGNNIGVLGARALANVLPLMSVQCLRLAGE